MTAGARWRGCLLALALAAGCDGAREVDVRLDLAGQQLRGEGFTYRRSGHLWVEADLRGANGARASVVLRSTPGWTSGVLHLSGGEERRTWSENVEIIGPLEPGRGQVWRVVAPHLTLEVVFLDGLPERPLPSGSESSEPEPDDPAGAGCGIEEEEDDEAGWGCGGDPVEAPGDPDDNARWGDDGWGSEANDNDRWSDEPNRGRDAPADDGSADPSCSGDPVDDGGSSLQGVTRGFRFAWPFVVVLAVNRGSRRRVGARGR